MLKDDHRTVEQLFKRFEKAGDRAYTEKRKIVDRIVEDLAKHAAIEEQLFYPVARATVDGTEDIVLESLEEHHIVKWVLAELDGMDATAERFDANATLEGAVGLLEAGATVIGLVLPGGLADPAAAARLVADVAVASQRYPG